MKAVAAAYSATGAAWQAGPGRVYDVLSEHLVERAPVGLAGRVVVDLGAGTGAASRALLRRDARPVALDAAEGMLRADAPTRPPSVVADALHLPVGDDCVDGLVAAYSLNHVHDPVAALREAGRIVRPGGPILAAVYAADDNHDAKSAVERAAEEVGHIGTDWYDWMRGEAAPLLATVERAERALAGAGLVGWAVHHRIELPQLGPEALVAWRLGMAHLAPFVASLDPLTRRRLEVRALELVGTNPPLLVRSVITLVAVAA